MTTERINETEVDHSRMRKCSDCAYWVKWKPVGEDDLGDIGICHRNAPFAHSLNHREGGVRAFWPDTWGNDWCGEWQMELTWAYAPKKTTDNQERIQ